MTHDQAVKTLKDGGSLVDLAEAIGTLGSDPQSTADEIMLGLAHAGFVREQAALALYRHLGLHLPSDRSGLIQDAETWRRVVLRIRELQTIFGTQVEMEAPTPRALGREPDLTTARSHISDALATALCEPLAQVKHPAVVLDVGDATGRIARHIARLLEPADQLDICEVHEALARCLEREVLIGPDFAPLVARGNVRVVRDPLERLGRERRYDFVISGVPFRELASHEIADVFAAVRRCLKPEGVFSYFEYALAPAGAARRVGSRRDRYRAVHAYLSAAPYRRAFGETDVLTNWPPARAHFVRLEL